jgi:hypothetical protein
MSTVCAVRAAGTAATRTTGRPRVRRRCGQRRVRVVRFEHQKIDPQFRQVVPLHIDAHKKTKDMNEKETMKQVK